MEITLKKNKKSFVLLFSVLISTAILLISSGIFLISFKETIISSYANESQIAFYNADSIMECILYIDILKYVKDTTGIIDYKCFGKMFEINESGTSIWRAQKEFSNGGCAIVKIEKKVHQNPNGLTVEEVHITASGFNICDDENPSINNPMLVERRLYVKYGGSTRVTPN